MNKSGLKNIVFLKEVSSNIVDEAIIILKPNVKVKEFIGGSKGNEDTKKTQNKNSNYILNEAQMVISNYISKTKNEDKSLSRKYEKKIKSMKLINIGLIVTVIGLIVSKIF